jgi:hypothetical protein
MATNNGAVVTQDQQTTKLATRKSFVAIMAEKYDMNTTMLLDTIKATVFPDKGQGASDAQVAAFLVVANQYNLNPFIREIFAFPTRGGGIMPIVSIDGWISLITSHPDFAWMEYNELKDKNGNFEGGECKIYRKSVPEHPTVVQEYFEELKRDTDPWKKCPRRMTRHKTIIQCGRVAFGFSGLSTEDDAQEINITAQSTEISRETNSKTEALKEKIGAKKAAKAEKTPEPVIDTPVTPIEQAAVTTQPAPDPDPVPVVTQEAIPEQPPFDLEEAPKSPVVEDRVLNETEYNTLLAVLRTKGTTDDKKQTAIKEARQKFNAMGYKNAKEIKVADYDALLKWAQDLKV